MVARFGSSVRRRLAAAFVLEVVVLGAVGLTAFAATPMVSGRTDASALVECRTGIETQGDVQISALVVARVPPASVPSSPGDCVVSP